MRPPRHSDELPSACSLQRAGHRAQHRGASTDSRSFSVDCVVLTLGAETIFINNLLLADSRITELRLAVIRLQLNRESAASHAHIADDHSSNECDLRKTRPSLEAHHKAIASSTWYSAARY
ncbi:hypothetical protein B5X24_HaOG208153 [Helicoverpa armigera]|uniref:Uncharacterized protein n=1 Tax=Helicoverpa armigera TaxID=29058 RepID=A0A2W1BHE4_HELAM|nr:hypothetical protein B5X24_HaOG208153 [Helicoverpa armigera]